MKKILLTSALLLGGLTLTIPALASCSSTLGINQSKTTTENIRVASFNISFAVDGAPTYDEGGPDYYDRWEKYMSYSREEQDSILNEWAMTGFPKVEKGQNLDNDNIRIANRIAQIRNIAASIQYVRPDIVLLNEFNNNGTGDSNIMNLFQKNYLSYPQTYDGVLGKKKTKPIEYPYSQEYATNTGLVATDENGVPLDLDNDGYVSKIADSQIDGKDFKGQPITIRKGQIYSEKTQKATQPNAQNQEGVTETLYKYSPDDAFGFGYYHGHYAFGIMSKFPLKTNDARTFKNFKLKDMPNSEQYRAKVDSRVIKDKKKFIDHYDNVELKPGDYWHNDKDWNNIRMSAKNHVDLPVEINGEIVHLLLSHPTPSGFDKASPTNILLNRAEIDFWKHYINGEETLYDDKGVKGGLPSNSKFIILGDLNADNFLGKDSTNQDDKNYNDLTNYNNGIGIRSLVSDKLINQTIVNSDGVHVPISVAGKYAINPPNTWNDVHPFPQVRTSVFGSRADWAMPSSNIHVYSSSVFWHKNNEPAYKLFNDKRLGFNGDSKEVSSDHRMVYVNIKI